MVGPATAYISGRADRRGHALNGKAGGEKLTAAQQYPHTVPAIIDC